MSSAYERIVEALREQGSQQVGRNWSCPSHDDLNPSLTVDDGEDRVLLHCQAGCTPDAVVQALGLRLVDLFDSGGCTIGSYSALKKLPVEFLHEQGLKQQKYQGRVALRIPYRDEQGLEVAVRYRMALDGDSKFRWRAGTKTCLYGLWRLRRAKEAGYVVLVEGESCAQTCWLHDVPAIGLPGAANWNEARDAVHLDGIATIYVIVEPDRGGDTVVRWLEKSSIRERARLVSLTDGADASESYLADPPTFRARFDAALKTATPWTEFSSSRATELEQGAWQECEQLAREPRILDRFVHDLREHGVVGEERQASIVYLAVTSRLLDRPVSVAVKGTSSGGKSFVSETTLGFFPETAYYALSAMSERALAYSEEPLEHRVLVLYEAAALEGDFASYLVRSLLSEGCIRYETVEKTEDGLRARLIERPGPTGLLVTTTESSCTPKTRLGCCRSLSPIRQKQTKAIFHTLARQQESQVPAPEWHALQRWIELRSAQVTIPYASALAELIPPLAVRLRRDVRTLFSLIEAHALLHQANRDRDSEGRVCAAIDDYAVVRELVAGFLAEGVSATVSGGDRETVGVVATHTVASVELSAGHVDIDFRHSDGMSVTAIADAIGIDISAAHRRVAVAVKAGYLKNLETKPRRKGRYVPDNPLPDDSILLPSPEDVVCTFARSSDPTTAPTSSDESKGVASRGSRKRANVQTPRGKAK